MACERVHISVLVVDDDLTSLATVANILTSLEYKVLTANGASHALETLREFEGFFDLVITELHISGMNGFEFLKRVHNEFQIPVIMMSSDGRKSVMSKSLANGAAHYILKPFCKDDFKDIWQYCTDARKRKLTIENTEGESLPGDNIFIQNGNSATSSNENKRKRKYCKRMSTQMNKENQSEGGPRLVKKPKVVWTPYLHNLFLLAIKQIGLQKIVPKSILEVMNVPNLTRENVASHLQKYRLFLRKVAQKGLLEGLSNRDLKSRFASGFSPSMIKDLQTRTAKLHVPVHQPGYGGIVNVVKPNNHVSRSNNYVTNNTPPGRSHQFPHPYHKGMNMMLQNQLGGNSLNQAELGVQSNFGIKTNAGANPPYYEKISHNNAGAVSDGTMGHSLVTSENGPRGGLKYGDNQLMNPNRGSLNYHHNFIYGQGNWKMGSLNNTSNNLPWSTTSTYNPSSSNIQLNCGSQMVGNGTKGGLNSSVGVVDSIANNSFGLVNGTTPNANKNVAPLGQGKFGLAQGGFDFASASGSDVDSLSSDQIPAALITNNETIAENIPRNPQLSQQLDGNVADNDNATMEYDDDLSNIFMMLDEMDILETKEKLNANEYLKSDIPSSSHSVQSLEQSNSASDVIVNPIESTLNLPNESSTSSDKNSSQVRGNDRFADMEPLDRFMIDDVASPSTSAAYKDWDIELVEALFGDLRE